MFTDDCRLVGEILDLPPVKRRIRSMQLVDGWLLLSSTSETLAVPLPSDASLEPGATALLAVAAHLGRTRLIDNVVLGSDPRP